MIARSRSPRRLRHERQVGRRAGPERDPTRANREPRGCAPGGIADQEDPGPTTWAEREAGRYDVDDNRLGAGVCNADELPRRADEGRAHRRRGQRDDRPGRARARGRGHEHEGGRSSEAGDHRPMTVNVTVAE